MLTEESRQHLERCDRCRELVDFVKEIKTISGDSKPSHVDKHPSRMEMTEVINRTYEGTLQAVEAANFAGHVGHCPRCLKYVETVFEESFSPIGQDLEDDLTDYSPISIAENVLDACPPDLPEQSLASTSIWSAFKRGMQTVFEAIQLRPGTGLAVVVVIFAIVLFGQRRFRQWRAEVHTNAGFEALRQDWMITTDDLRPSGGFPLSIFSVTHAPGASEAPNEAVKQFSSALDWDKNDNAAYRGLATSAYFQGRLARADSLLKLLIAQDPQDYQAWNMLGLIAARLQDSTRALVAFERASKIRPDFVEAIYNSARIFELTGQTEAARRAYQQYLQIDPQSEWADWVRRKLSTLKPGKE
ncbi:MAG: tetratricopeptide repeat protein [bacterium]